MFCPKCGCEYREGFTECSDCKIPLVVNLPIEKNQENVEFKEVTSTLRQDEISIIKSILDATEINYVIHGESFGTMYNISGTSRLMVEKEEYE
ncbi:MAG: DUF2007 domain-containing protein, partial [Proteobacteria bacterium]|nr:DUF2007 domain-containing protein [Pseudomonadota bacterium]MBU1583264.1 DUF2007 domain-containing protein [Pseudomonadota bacterium]